MYVDFNKKNIKINIVKSNFLPIFTKYETRYLINKYFNNSFNSQSVRLENIEIDKNSELVILNLSETDFFSLLTSNIIYRKDIKDDDENIKEKLQQFKNQDVNDLTVLNNNNFSNNLAVSVMIEDINSQKLLVKRTSKVAIGTSLISVSATGGVDFDTISNPNPISTTVKKEIKEELGLNIEEKQVVLEGIFIGQYKLQPVVICSVKLNNSFKDLKLYGEDTKFEIDEIHIVTNHELHNYLECPMSEAARFQIKKILKLV